MNSRLPALLVFFALLASPAFAACEGDPVALKKVTTEDLDSGIIVSRQTVILRPAPNGWSALLLRQVVGSELDLCFTVSARIDEDPKSSGGGIQFWRSGNTTGDDYYALKIDAGGNAVIGRSEDGKWENIVKWGRSKLLKRGINVRNEIRLTTSGDTAKLYINGKLFKTVERQGGGKGGYGTALMVETGKAVTQFDFSDVRSSTQTQAAPSDGAPQASAEAVPTLDAEGQRLFDALVAAPPTAMLAELGTEFAGTQTNPSGAGSYDHPQVTYALKPPAGATETSLSFVIYPDSETAGRYFKKVMEGLPTPFQIDIPRGTTGTGGTTEAFAPFDRPLDYTRGFQPELKLGWLRYAYQVGRVVILARTGEELPDAKPGDNATSEAVFRRGELLLAIGKLKLDEWNKASAQQAASPAEPSDDTQKTADTPAAEPALDAEGKRIYDLLLAVPPLSDNVAFAKTKFIRATGNPSPKENSGHGGAEVTYSFEPPAGGTENRIQFFIYPDAEAAKAYMPNRDNPLSMLRDNLEGSISNRTAEPDGPFAEPIHYVFGYQTLKRSAWTRWMYQEGRVVMVAFTDETLPPLKEGGVTTDKISEGTLDQGYFLLQIAKFQLDAIKDMKISKETRPASGAASALDPQAKATFDRLLATPLDPDSLERLGTSFLETTSSLSPKPARGQAEIVYQLKPPAEGVETSIAYFFYPDEAAADRYLEGLSTDSFVYDVPGDKFVSGTLDPFATFDRPIQYQEGTLAAEQRRWIRAQYKVGRIVIVALAGEKDANGGDAGRVSDATVNQLALLLALGKQQLDAIKDLKIETQAKADSGAPAPLDAAGMRVYEWLLANPLGAGSLAQIDSELNEAEGNLSPKLAHGQAEIVYHLKPPAEGIETSLSYYFYGDAAAAARYLDLAQDHEVSLLSDLPDGQMGRGTVDPFGPFDSPIPVFGGGVQSEHRGWARLPYQDGRVVIVALVGEKTSGDGPYKVSDQATRQGALLLALGKLQLDAALNMVAGPEPAAQPASDAPQESGAGPSGQATGVAPTPKVQ